MEVPNDRAMRQQDATTSLNDADSSPRPFKANAAETARIKEVATPD
jgi:hypothetical protein